LIDLHLHTTASDGRLSPVDLVRQVAAAGITIMSVTDHDTVAGLSEVGLHAEQAGIELVPGIEVTSIFAERDVHLLGYFFDPGDEALSAFLALQRSRRLARVQEIVARLAALDLHIDLDLALEAAANRPGASVGRPVVARALIAAGHAVDMQDAFERLLGFGRPAFVPRVGPTPRQVFDVVHGAGGLVSMAHPGIGKQPSLMMTLVRAGIDAIEVYHSDHTPLTEHELRGFADDHDLLVTGGSDFHGDDGRHRPLGGVALPAADFDRLRATVATRASSREAHDSIE
jgi:3',5'-nucleoside bisphosphate phosphatase